MADAVERVELDVAIVGAGPAGIAAAVRASEGARRVGLIDDGTRAGGQIWRHQSRDDLPRSAREWLARLDQSTVTRLPGTAVVDTNTNGDGWITLRTETGGRAGEIRCRALVMATGARERFLLFAGWTLPGVIGAGGAQALLKGGMSVRGKRAIVAGSGPLLLAVAAALRKAGARVLLVAEQAPAGRVAGFGVGLLARPATLLQAVRYRAALAGTRYALGTWISAAVGDGHVREALVSRGGSAATRTIACDLLCVGYGLVPAVEVPRLLGCAMDADVVRVDARLATSIHGVYCAGESLGIGGVECAVIEGQIAGLCAAGLAAPPPALSRARQRARNVAHALDRAFALREELRHLADDATIVCRCEDVAARSIDPRWTSRQAKLYTRAGMGACQGRVCGGALRFLYQWDADTVRPPLTPARLSSLMEHSAIGTPAP